MIGEGGLLNALNDVQYAISKERPDYVIVGEGRVLGFELVEQAHRCIADGQHFCPTNADTWCPTNRWSAGRGCGAIVALLEAATGTRAYHVGKPNPFMMRAAWKRIGLSTDEVIDWGHDGDGHPRGYDLGYRSILVMTGSTAAADLQRSPFAPTRIGNRLPSCCRRVLRWRRRTL